MKSSITEALKNMILVVLFITTILLLYLIWQPDMPGLSGIFGLGEAKQPSLEPADVISAEYLIYSDGKGAFELQQGGASESFELALSVLKEAVNPQAFVYDITREQFEKASTEYRSVLLHLGYRLPLADALAFFTGMSQQELSALSGVNADEICFSDALKNGVLIFDGASQYSRIVFESDTNALALFESQKGGHTYTAYKAGSVLGGSGAGLIPLSVDSDAIRVIYIEESEKDRSIAQEIAESVFGKNFDFVRRITDNLGNLTYMYGSGAKTLNVSTDGSFEFVIEQGERPGQTTGFFAGLQTALDFFEDYGGLSENAKGRLRLCSYENQTYKFEYVFADMPAGMETNCCLEAALQGGQVKKAYRYLLYTAAERGEQTAAAEAANVIAANSAHIYGILTDSLLSAPADDALDLVSQNIRVMLPGYYISRTDRELIPAWILKTNQGVSFYFDLYDGHPLGYER